MNKIKEIFIKLKKIFLKELIILFFSVMVFLITNKIGLSLVSFLLLKKLLLEEVLYKSPNKFFKIIMGSLFLYIIGYKFSLFFVLQVICVPAMEKAFTFYYGFIGGIVELGLYIFIALFGISLLCEKTLRKSLDYSLRKVLFYALLGGISQGTYMAGWQNLFYV